MPFWKLIIVSLGTITILVACHQLVNDSCRSQLPLSKARRWSSAKMTSNATGMGAPWGKSRIATATVFGVPNVNWSSLWNAHQKDKRCTEEKWDSGSSHTFGAVIVELRVFPPLIASLTLSHRILPVSWPFHIFHANFTHDKRSQHWFLHGDMAKAIKGWQHRGRRVLLHTYDDAWHDITRKRHTRPSNTYPRIRDFWTKFFFEDKIVTLQSDTGFCPSSPFKLEQFMGTDWNGATWGSQVIERGIPGQGGLSLRNRHAMYNCIDWLEDRTQHGSRSNKSVLWDWSWHRNEDAMFVKCMRGAAGDARIEQWRGKKLHYRVSGVCLANKWAREHPAIDAIVKGHPPPFGVHAICRAIESYGKCKWVVGALRAPQKSGEPTAHAYVCEREGFSVDRAFDAFSDYCGANLDYMRSCFDFNASMSPGMRPKLIEGRHMGRTLDARSISGRGSSARDVRR